MFSLAVFVIAADQFSKMWIDRVKPFIEVIPGFFNITYVRNPGAAFGILQGRQYLLAIISSIAGLVLIAMLLREDEKKKVLLLSLSLVLGGTIGNLIDRLRFGYVIDFLDVYVSFGREHHWPSFNIADSAISCGVVLLICAMLVDECACSKQKVSPSDQNTP
ncbi:signal peptidase II [candidate division KSB3 bacterium]|uniref:Lipoprotein signal peptidase n=1 Tax=candidate division KSB3 bacterium TaxID=2044937 RepID=A0A2G6E700_9BACT|nr:MAG: signal peptidase II [candidate division KSB3 bacterium]PIE30297.1 MAG: signal peptidase II [candidate division KSB3 bacterium]